MNHQLAICILIAEWTLMIGVTSIAWITFRRRHHKADNTPRATITLNTGPGIYIPTNTPMTLTINGNPETYRTTSPVMPGDTTINLMKAKG